MRVNEIFTSIQGEGFLAGLPAHFIRLQGCPLHCHFCDTKGSWDGNEGKEMNLGCIKDEMERLRKEYPNVFDVVLTGGEPMAQKGLLDLVKFLCVDWAKGLPTPAVIQIETSGTVAYDELAEYAKNSGWNIYITISPKAPTPQMKEYLPVDKKILDAAKEIKFVVADELDISRRIPAFFTAHPELPTQGLKPNCLINSLQPVRLASGANDPKSTKIACVEAISRGWRVSSGIQHNLGVR